MTPVAQGRSTSQKLPPVTAAFRLQFEEHEMIAKPSDVATILLQEGVYLIFLSSNHLFQS